MNESQSTRYSNGEERKKGMECSTVCVRWVVSRWFGILPVKNQKMLPNESLGSLVLMD